MQSAPTAISVLGKRKQPQNYVLRLPSGSEYEGSECDSDSTAPKLNPILINGKLVIPQSKKIYACTVEGCVKTYSKPSRLLEHQRSHTGERPFACVTCGKTYLRESHLQAHSRSHLPSSARSFECSEPNCDKRFWTSQHLKAHVDWHQGIKPFPCDQPDCTDVFAKHNQLKAHIAAIHCPPGTKPFQCSHQGCDKSFSTNQHLRAHLKTHDDKRYTCSHPQCLPMDGQLPQYFSNWTSFQRHNRTVHPPTCPHAECKGKTFSCRENLRGHLKLHEQREAETSLLATTSTEDGEERPYKRRRGGELGRDWVCSVERCSKAFKSKKALTTHVNISHLKQRNFVCPHVTCDHTFGYKHLLQRHLLKAHGPNIVDQSASSDEETMEDTRFSIAGITGAAYLSQAKERTNSGKALKCPYPNLADLCVDHLAVSPGPSTCEYAFTRAYDLRRHLKAVHQVVVSKEHSDTWVKRRKNVL